jgi:hypothetical protein
MKFITNTIRQDKEIKRIQIDKEKVKFYIYK